MYLDKDIVKEGNPELTTPCEKVRLPLSEDEETCIRGMFEYLVVSGVDELVKKYKIRPGVGLAAPQVNVSKRMFCMNCNDFLDKKNKNYTYALINPQIIAHSEEMTYLPGGEGCLSVVRDTTGLVTPRYYAIKFRAQEYDYKSGKVKSITKVLEGYPAIVFQHEYDHLDGILYTSKMYKKEDLDIPPLYTIEEDDEEDDEKSEA